jgi:hypothetical protein
MMRSVTLILGCCLVLIIRKVEWNELTGHPKNHGKDRPNSRMNSLQHGENDANQIEIWSLSITALDPAMERTLTLNRTHARD